MIKLREDKSVDPDLPPPPVNASAPPEFYTQRPTGSLYPSIYGGVGNSPNPEFEIGQFSLGVGQTGSFIPGRQVGPGFLSNQMGSFPFPGSYPGTGLMTGSMPRQPEPVAVDSVAFSAVRASPSTRKFSQDNTHVLFDITLTNVGNGWFPDRGEFICPIPGIYLFMFSGLSSGYDNIRLSLVKNNQEIVSCFGENDGIHMGSNSAILTLHYGDRLFLKLAKGIIGETNEASDRGYTTFSGFRISGSFPFPGSSSGTGLMTGYMPRQPEPVAVDSVAFSAVRASPSTRKFSQDNTQVLFDFTLTNVGNGWFPDRGEFICPIPGIYLFMFSGLSSGYDNIRLSLVKNNQEIVSCFGENDGNHMGSNYAILTLHYGDRLFLKLAKGFLCETNEDSKRGYTTFSGFRISGSFPFPGSSSGTGLMTGYMPRQPEPVAVDSVAFSAVRASPSTRKFSQDNTQVLFDFTLTNVGNGWFPDRGEFICPIPGIYLFMFSGLSTDHANFRLFLVKNNQKIVACFGETNGNHMGSNSAIFTLHYGDRLFLKLTKGILCETKENSDRGYTTFSGFRIC